VTCFPIPTNVYHGHGEGVVTELDSVIRIFGEYLDIMGKVINTEFHRKPLHRSPEIDMVIM